MNQPEAGSESDESIRALERMFPGAQTLGECLRCHYDRSLASLWPKLPDGARFRRHLLRYYEPWPDWALRAAVEVSSVYFPTIKKEVILASFQLFHAFVFEMRFDGSGPVKPLPFPEINAEVIGKMFGHALAMPGYLQTKLDDALGSGLLSEQEHADFATKHAKELSEDELQREMQPHLNRYFSARPTKIAEFSGALAKAKAKTLDEEGRLKETTLTKIYEKILENWPEIEEMSGPTELCGFLGPLLVGSENDPNKKLDRVKKICGRLGIRFRSIVKGESV